MKPPIRWALWLETMIYLAFCLTCLVFTWWAPACGWKVIAGMASCGWGIPLGRRLLVWWRS